MALVLILRGFCATDARLDGVRTKRPMARLRAAILCGGAGTRLWPLSRDHAPKQFHPLIGDRSLLTETVSRALDLDPAGVPLVVTAESFADAALEHAKAAGASDVRLLLEPAPRNTAPAAAMAAHAAMEDDADAVVVLLPSDHHIADRQAFARTVAEAVALAEQGHIVTLGMVPDDANTGYGYIRRGTPLGTGFTVANFKEKPDQAAAEAFLASGDYYWNGGIFVFRARVLLDELRTHRPAIAAAAEAAWRAGTETPAGRLAGREAWLACPAESIDHAVAENTSLAAVVPARFGWSDLGSWLSLLELAPRDAEGNAKFGAAWTIDSNGCYVRSTSRTVAVIGAQDMIVVETADAVLIVHKSATQQVKQVAAQLGALRDAAE